MPSQGGHATYLVIVLIVHIFTYLFRVNIYFLAYSHLQSQTPDITLPTSNVPSHKLRKLNAIKRAQILIWLNIREHCVLL